MWTPSSMILRDKRPLPEPIREQILPCLRSDIVLSSANATLAQLHETMMWHVCRARRQVNEGAFWPGSPHSHGPLMHCILAGDADGAAMAMRRHMGEVARKMLTVLREAPLAGQRG